MIILYILLNSQQMAISRPRALPPQRFQPLLTLFSKSYSSFPHGTCSLSVSYLYLVLGGVYHLLRAAIPSSPTLGLDNDNRSFLVIKTLGPQYGALTLSGTPFQGIYTQGETSVISNHETTIQGTA